MTFTMTFETNSAAFETVPEAEVASILRSVAERVRDHAATEGAVMDINGNKIGDWSYTTELADPETCSWCVTEVEDAELVDMPDGARVCKTCAAETKGAGEECDPDPCDGTGYTGNPGERCTTHYDPPGFGSAGLYS